MLPGAPQRRQNPRMFLWPPRVRCDSSPPPFPSRLDYVCREPTASCRLEYASPLSTFPRCIRTKPVSDRHPKGSPSSYSIHHSSTLTSSLHNMIFVRASNVPRARSKLLGKSLIPYAANRGSKSPNASRHTPRRISEPRGSSQALHAALDFQ